MKFSIPTIVPSVCYETFGIVLIEAFRQGSPVIARRLGPFPEIVERSGGGADAYCSQRYRSYDPSSGTYLGYDGERHPCP